jgi:hypothetical protein
VGRRTVLLDVCSRIHEILLLFLHLPEEIISIISIQILPVRINILQGSLFGKYDLPPPGGGGKGSADVTWEEGKGICIEKLEKEKKIRRKEDMGWGGSACLADVPRHWACEVRENFCSLSPSPSYNN